ncbi:hypothetical protein MYAER_4282 [Microcystis aeruginosa NIES-2549]|uniref:Uncharacterized protein n=1 Tax=Microcystis aeruginosa NIES-2549 TaxID=1641812 RepID=A0A0F6U7Z8_MICAE|nr:hypothetical protein MYAER_4282 [Microcystis aeruginosa NIES-2549]AOC55006.1 hypothetical protein amyaer_4329 [Microcystis aeruginosa NIES-2481]
MLGTCALIMRHLAGLVLLQSDFLAGILFLRKSLTPPTNFLPQTLA